MKKGNALVAVLVVLGFLALIGLGVYLIYHSNNIKEGLYIQNTRLFPSKYLLKM